MAYILSKSIVKYVFSHGDTILRTSCRLHATKMAAIPSRLHSTTMKKPGERHFEIKVDSSALVNMRSISDEDNEDAAKQPSVPNEVVLANKEPLSELGKDLHAYITMKGPMTVNEYMSYCLNHPKYGYYQRKSDDKIGGVGNGDFITAPEISQLFGEIIAIWFISIWKDMGEPSSFDLIEMGPGNGTLMVDMLRVFKKFPKFKKSMRIRMIELSDTMRTKQKSSLNCKTSINSGIDLSKLSYTTGEGIPITWHNFLDEIPAQHPCFIIAQEFLDIFPVHQFVYQNGSWREKLVDIDKDPNSVVHFRTVVAPKETPAVRALLGGKNETIMATKKIIDEANASGGNVKDLLSKQEGGNSESPITFVGRDGDGVEICPLALATCEDIAIRVNKIGGAALLFDYGENFTQADTIRAYKKHKQVSFLSEPGSVDITADVDFSACARAVARKGAKVLGPLQQGAFLLNMGIMERVQHLIDSDSTTDEQADQLMNSYEMLVDPEKMGQRFKVISISNPSTIVHGFPPDSVIAPK